MAAPKKNAKAGGRKKGVPNKVTREIKEIAQLYSREAIEKAVDIMRGPRTPAAVKLQAIEKILERAHGKPAQAHHHSGAVGSYDATKLAGFSLEELKAFEALLTRIDAGPTAAIGYSSGDSET